MLAIEGALDRNAEAILPRIASDHSGPGYHLQSGEVDAASEGDD